MRLGSGTGGWGLKKDRTAGIHKGGMDFVLDGKPRKCIKGGEHNAAFDDDYQWCWIGDTDYFEEVNMDIQGQIYKLKVELERLEKMVAEEKMEFDSSLLYIAYRDNSKTYILYRTADDGFEWCSHSQTGGRWCAPVSSGEEALRNMKDNGFSIKSFNTKKEALTFMLEQE